MNEILLPWKARAARARAWTRQHPRLTLAALIVVALWLAYHVLTQPGAMFGRQDGTWRRSQINGDLYVGLEPDYPPFAEWTPDGIEGIEADIARELGRRIGAETSILIMGYDGLYDALFLGNVDLLISGLSENAAFDEWVYYTRPYFDAGQILVARADAPVQSMRDLDRRTVAVELASAGDRTTQRWQRRLHALDIQRYLLPTEAMDAVRSGQADAALVDVVSARLYVHQHPGMVMADDTTVPLKYVIALREENFRLSEEIDQALADMIADGTLDEIIARWL